MSPGARLGQGCADATRRAPMKMIQRLPGPALAGKVIMVWSLRGTPLAAATGVPKPYAEFCISLSGVHHWSDGGGETIYADGWLTPLQSGPRFVRSEGGYHIVAVRLHPAAAVTLCGASALAPDARPIPLEALLGSQLRALHERMLHARDEHSRMSVLENAVAGLLAAAPEPLRLPGATTLARAAWRVDALGDHFDLSPRALRYRMQGLTGVSPKYWVRLMRLDTLLKDRRFVSGEDSLSAIAARYGFADQAHMNLEFRRLAHVAPGAYRQSRIALDDSARRGAPNLVPLIADYSKTAHAALPRVQQMGG